MGSIDFISYNAGGAPTALRYSGSRNDALAEGKKRINSWLRRQKKPARSSPVSSVNPDLDNASRLAAASCDAEDDGK